MKDKLKTSGILVVDFGSQFTWLIIKKFRKLGYYSEVHSPKTNIESLPFKVRAIILSGGPESVTDENSPKLNPSLIENIKKIPTLGICYGMQLLVEHFGGSVVKKNKREYGAATQCLLTDNNFPHTNSFIKEIPKSHKVWMSHGDHIKTLPDNFIKISKTEADVICAMSHKTLPIFGLQYHPEVFHSQYGETIFDNFIKLSGMTNNWSADSIIEKVKTNIKEQLKNEASRVLIAVSGGVDSSVCAASLAKFLGKDKIFAVFVDHGLLRHNEAKDVTRMLEKLDINLEVIDARSRFFENLCGVSDPEKKRKIIGKTFIDVFEEHVKFAKIKFTHLAQGTLYPDVIESAKSGHGSHVIKSHHNVGGLPESLSLKLLEPFRLMFKDEIRSLGNSLGLPKEFIDRHPFPGPGLAIRIVGEITPEKIKISQLADDIFIKFLKKEGFYHKVWQAGVVLLPVKSVGVMGDKRTYEWTCVLRAVGSEDGMTADVSPLPHKFLTKVAVDIVREVQGINKVLYDITSKPPSTIEWE